MTSLDSTALLAKLNASPDLSDTEKAYLRQQLTSQKKYGLIWEDKPELVEQQLLENLPVLTEVPERRVESVQRPASSVQRPASSVQRPASSVQRPASSVQRPASSVQRPASSVQRPAK